MWLYRILFAFDVLVVLVLVYFFLDALQYAGVADSLIGWLPVIGVPIGVLIVAAILRGKGKTGGACVLLAIMAVPPFLFAAFFGLLIAANPRWN